MDQSKIWEYFQSDQSHYDVFELSIPRYRYIAKHISRGSMVLNIGVGRGGLEEILINKGVDAFCLDPSELSIEGVKSRLGIGEKAKVGYSQSIPFPNETFDVVVMSEVLEHLDDAVLHASLDEVNRVLKRGGEFLGTVPADEILQDNWAICPCCSETFHRWGHVQTFSREAIQELLHHHKFKRISAKFNAFPDFKRKSLKGFVKSAARGLLGKMGVSIAKPSIFFSCQKDSKSD